MVGNGIAVGMDCFCARAFRHVRTGTRPAPAFHRECVLSHPSSFILHLSSPHLSSSHPSSFIFHPLIFHPSSFILHPSSFIPSSFIFHPLISSSSHPLICSSSHLFILSSVHLFLASFDHISDLLHTRMLVRAVEETRVIGQRTDETVMRIEPVVDEHVAES